jgi:muramidase (phage lysozyme)
MKYQIRNLLDFIAKPESGGDYNIVWGRIKAKDYPPKPLVNMTIGEVLAWQDNIDSRYRSEAAGKYQILEDTLRGLYKPAGMNLTDLFDEAGQDKLAVALLNRRGLQEYLKDKITAEKFADNLSKEWASLPAIFRDRKGRPATGQSYYAGDGLNKAHVSIKELMSVVEQVKVNLPVPIKPTNIVKPEEVNVDHALIRHKIEAFCEAMKRLLKGV